MRFLIVLVSLITILSVGSLFFIANFTSPKALNGQLVPINLIYFFLSFFLCLAGFVTLVLYWLGSLRLKLERKGSPDAVNRPKTIFKRSLRQAILFSTVVTGIGILRAIGLANPLNTVLLVSAAILIEIYFFGH